MSSYSSSSSATVRVEKATSEFLNEPDWTLNIDICDSINTDHGLAKDVVKAVKKRLQHKSPKIQFLALTLLETMVKNCGDYIHFQVVEREIPQEMAKIVKKKTDMSTRDKILVLLDSWQEAFGGPGGKYPQFYLAYADLKKSGIEFPQHSPEAGLIFTPPIKHPIPEIKHPRAANGMPSNSSLRLEEAMASELSNLSLSDLDSMRSVMELLSDMLKATNPKDAAALNDEVIIDLVEECRLNQKKLLQLINTTRDEQILGQGLELNDSLQSVLTKHDNIASGSSLSDEEENPPSPSTPVVPPPAIANGNDDEEEDDDDGFAEIARRNSKPCIGAAPSTCISSPTGQSDIPCSTSESKIDGQSSSAVSNALSLSNMPTPVKTNTGRPDMVELLRMNLSPHKSPQHSPLTPPSVFHQNGSMVSNSFNEQGYPYNGQPYATVNQPYAPQFSYVAPWAQPQTHSSSPAQSISQPHVLNDSSSYPPPPWASDSVDADPISSSATTFNHSETEANGNHNGFVPYNSVPVSVPPQHYNSFSSTYSSSSPAISERRTGGVAQGGMQSPTAYVYKNRFFDELVYLRNADGSVKTNTTSLSAASNQALAAEENK